MVYMDLKPIGLYGDSKAKWIKGRRSSWTSDGGSLGNKAFQAQGQPRVSIEDLMNIY